MSSQEGVVEWCSRCYSQKRHRSLPHWRADCPWMGEGDFLEKSSSQKPISAVGEKSTEDTQTLQNFYTRPRGEFSILFPNEGPETAPCPETTKQSKKVTWARQLEEISFFSPDCPESSPNPFTKRVTWSEDLTHVFSDQDEIFIPITPARRVRPHLIRRIFSRIAGLFRH